MKAFSMAWVPSAFLTRRRRAISPGVSMSKTSRPCNSVSTGRGGGCGNSSRKDFWPRHSWMWTARLPERTGSARAAWDCRTRGFGVMRRWW
jgi:hypothetical protein